MSKKAVIKIGADVKEAKDGIDKVNQQLTNLQNTAKKNTFIKLAENVSSVGKAFGVVTTAVKKVNESIKENIELAKKTTAGGETA